MCEWCCGPASKIGNQNTAISECQVTRITESDDGTTQKATIKAISAISKPRMLLWSSMPCTGGSPWMRINVKKPGGYANLRKHIQLFNKLWNNFESVARNAHRLGNYIAIEWPRGCSYWLLTKVIKLCKELDLQYVDFDGCMLGLTSIYNKLPIKKPWRIATNSPAIREEFDNLLCKGHSVHHPCAGRDTKLTENYTASFVDKLHAAWKKQATNISKIRRTIRAQSTRQTSAQISNRSSAHHGTSCTSGRGIEVQHLPRTDDGDESRRRSRGICMPHLPTSIGGGRSSWYGGQPSYRSQRV